MDGESKTSRGVRGKKTIPGVIPGGQCVCGAAIRDPTIVEVAWDLGPRSLQSAAELGSGGALTESRTTIQSRNQSCCPLFSLFLSRCPRGRLPGLGAGRGNLQGRGWFETRPPAGVGRRAHTGPVQVWMQRSVALAGTGPNGKRARRDVGGQKYLHRDPRKADLQMAMAAYGNGQWAMDGNGNGKLHGEAGQGADSGVISSALDPDDPSGHHRGLLLYGGRYLGICRVVERRLLAPSLVVAWDVGIVKGSN